MSIRRVERGVFLAEPGAVGGDGGDAVAVEAEDDLTLQHGSRVVEVDDRGAGAAQCLKRAVDQVFPALHQHLDRDVGGETDFDLLVSHPYPQLEHAPLAFRGHRVDESLVSVAQIYGTPLGCLLDAFGRPRAITHVNTEWVRLVSMKGHIAGSLGCSA